MLGTELSTSEHKAGNYTIGLPSFFKQVIGFDVLSKIFLKTCFSRSNNSVLCVHVFKAHSLLVKFDRYTRTLLFSQFSSFFYILSFIRRHRACNIFARTYYELWLEEENLGQEVMIEDLTVSVYNHRLDVYTRDKYLILYRVSEVSRGYDIVQTTFFERAVDARLCRYKREPNASQTQPLDLCTRTNCF
jgi:hypothetical protein